MDPRLPQSVIIILLWGRAHHPAAVVAVTPGQQAQLFQGLLVVCHFRPLGEEAGGHAADVESAGTAMQLSQPLAKRRPRLEGSHDGYRGDHRGCSCRDGEGLFHQIQVEENETWIKKEQIEIKNMPTAGRGRLALQEALSIKGLAEYLRERWRQLTGSRRQPQSTVWRWTDKSRVEIYHLP